MSVNIKKYLEYKERLEAEKKDSMKTMTELLNDDMRDSLSELSLADNHPADIGTEVYERSRDIAYHDKLRHKISAIDAALARFSKGEYGICEHCGREIPLERLDLIPSTTVCTECSRKEEEREQHSFDRQPVENEVLSRPFAHTCNQDSGQIEFDGEDAWQAVARYGTSESLQDLGTNRDIHDVNSLYENGDKWIGAVEEVETIATIREPGNANTIHYSKRP